MRFSKPNIIIFFLLITGIVLSLAIIVIALLYLYKKKQILYYQNIESLKLKNEKSILASRIEIQENTIHRISREIHDNINLSLTLAKLYLNTFCWDDRNRAKEQLDLAIEILSQSILNLSDISKSLNSDIISNQGLIRALEDEVNRIRKTNIFKIDFFIYGEPVYLDAQKELIIFRIIQEAFNNIIKHSNASRTRLTLHFTPTHIRVAISDNGKGFIMNPKAHASVQGAGLKNMESRAEMIGGEMEIKSILNKGTALRLNIPI